MTTEHSPGSITRIVGPVVEAIGLEGLRLYDVVLVGDLKLVGEVIRLTSQIATIQVYEDTAGLRVGEPVESTGTPLAVQLGPGLLGQAYDGLQRPLEFLGSESDFIQRGMTAAPLSRNKCWHFKPQVKIGQHVETGTILGIVPETKTIEHRILVPPGLTGEILDIREGEYNVDEVIAVIQPNNGKPPQKLSLTQSYPVRWARPFHARLVPDNPLITGMRVIDTFFPVAKGGSAIIPGGFGTGKTVIQHSLARWSDVDIVVYVGCGERGNEMAEVMQDLPQLEDPRTGEPLIERTVLIANTSNMPVAAREASIYTGITIAEYFRDMGYDVLLLADSTSRWGEALREISGRLEEMPGEEGYPAYLSARLSAFYERSGQVKCLGNNQSVERVGSVTIIGAVSPPGGDFSEPMTQNSMRLVGTFWALDYDLSRRRHYPAINWINSYSLYNLQAWYEAKVTPEWGRLVQDAMILLQRETELMEIVQLLGEHALSDDERLVLRIARMLREDFLQQSAFLAADQFSPLSKTNAMLKIIISFYDQARAAMQAGTSLAQINELPVLSDIGRMKEIDHQMVEMHLKSLEDNVQASFAALEAAR